MLDTWNSRRIPERQRYAKVWPEGELLSEVFAP